MDILFITEHLLNEQTAIRNQELEEWKNCEREDTQNEQILNYLEII